MKNLIKLIFIVILLCGSCLPADENPGDIARPENPELVKLPFAWPNGDEATMVTFGDRPLILSSYRQIGGGEMYLKVQDLFTGEEISRFGYDFSFASGFVNGKEELNMFATHTERNWTKDWITDVYRFWTTDLKTWKKEMVLPRLGDRHLLNTSLCKDPEGYLMAYESDKPKIWTTRLARSKDLGGWQVGNVCRQHERLPGGTLSEKYSHGSI